MEERVIMDKNIMTRLHAEMQTIYLEIARICEQNNLYYFVVGGTLIGAVVHKNFIPWDDDLDIAMPRDDYEKFITICRTQLGDQFFLHHHTTDPEYWLSFAKLRKNNTVFWEEKRGKADGHAGIYVDIFPFDYTSICNSLYHKIKWRLFTYLNNYIFARKTGKKIDNKRSAVLTNFFKMFSTLQLSIFRDKIMKSFDHGKRKYFVDLAGGRRLSNSYFKIEDILPVVELPFGSIKVKCPNNWNSYLVQLYTERYKIIPPPEQQVTHDPVYIRFSDGLQVKNENL